MKRKWKIIFCFCIVAIILIWGYHLIMNRKINSFSDNGGVHCISMTGTVKETDLSNNKIVVSIDDTLNEYKYDELTLIDRHDNLQKMPLEKNTHVRFEVLSDEPKNKKEINIYRIEVVK